MKKGLPLVLLFFLCVLSLQAQTPTVQDCAGAIPICQNSYSTTTGYTGTGNINDIPASDCPITCMSAGERNSVWYTFTVTSSGWYDFRITPYVGSDDYDWSLFNLGTDDCSGLQNTSLLPAYEISCNWSADGGITGANSISPNTGTDCWDASSIANNPSVWVSAGQTYYLNISNYTGYGAGHGYWLDMTHSTASIFDNVRPYMLNATTNGVCGTNQITVTMSENVLCSTVSAADFTVTGYTVTAVSGGSCAAGGSMENTFVLTVSPGLNSGNIPICINGSAGNITDLCGNATNPAAPANCRTLTLPTTTTHLSASQENICAGSTVTLTASGASGYNWSHGLGTAASVNVSPMTTTTYTVTGTSAGGCTSSNAVTITALGPNATASASSSYLCIPGVSTTLTATGGGTYHWSNGPTTAAQVVYPTASSTYIVTVTDAQSCTATASTTVGVANYGVLTPITETTCDPSAITFSTTPNVSGATSYTFTWYENPNALMNPCPSSSSGLSQVMQQTTPSQIVIAATDFNTYPVGNLTGGLNGWNENVSTTAAQLWSFGSIDGDICLNIRAASSGNFGEYPIADDCNKIAYFTGGLNCSGYIGIYLSFDWKCYGENGYDWGNVVYTTDLTGASGWTDVVPTRYNLQSTWQSVVNLDVTSALLNKTILLGFRWINDASVGTYPSFCVDNITLSGSRWTSTYDPPGTINTNHTYSCMVTANGGVCNGTSYMATNCSRVTTTCSTLPVDLLNFYGNIDGSVNVLHWVTASETNNDYFELQRSADGITFETIAVVDGAGNSNLVIDYETVDREPLPLAYYRLKQTDYDGAWEYSDIVILARTSTLDPDHFLLSPVPATDYINIGFNVAFPAVIPCGIFDVTGKRVLYQEFITNQGENTFTLDISSLSQGIYYVKLGENSPIVKKMIK